MPHCIAQEALHRLRQLAIYCSSARLPMHHAKLCTTVQ